MLGTRQFILCKFSACRNFSKSILKYYWDGTVPIVYCRLDEIIYEWKNTVHSGLKQEIRATNFFTDVLLKSLDQSKSFPDFKERG